MTAKHRGEASADLDTGGRAPTVILESRIACPHCGHQRTEIMPTDACQYFYECRGCGEVLRPKQGDCCVFCSYADVPCPPMQGRDAASRNCR